MTTPSSKASSTENSALADRFETYGDAKMELFDYIEVFYSQRRRHSVKSVQQRLNGGRLRPHNEERNRPC